MKNLKLFITVFIFFLSVLSTSANTNPIDRADNNSVTLSVGPICQVVNGNVNYGGILSLTFDHLYLGLGCLDITTPYSHNTLPVFNIGYGMNVTNKVTLIPTIGLLDVNDVSLNYGCIVRYTIPNIFSIDFNLENNFVGLGIGIKFNN